MLKSADTEGQITGLGQHLGKRAASVGLVAVVIYVFFFADFNSNGGDLRFGIQIAAFFLSYMLGLILASICWQAATMWLGRMNFRMGAAALARPTEEPAVAESFVETWWQNELVLDVFFSVVFLLCMFGIYFAIQPLIDLVAPNVQ
jgi:hypothetical protein